LGHLDRAIDDLGLRARPLLIGLLGGIAVVSAAIPFAGAGGQRQRDRRDRQKRRAIRRFTALGWDG